MTSKRCQALNGDLLTLDHDTLDLSQRYTCHVDVVHDGITHQVLSTSDLSAFNFAHTTGTFGVGDLEGYIVELLDNVAAQATHVYQAIVTSESGAIATRSHQSVEQALRLVGALRPTPTRLGFVIEPDDGAEIVSAPKIALQTGIGVLEATPLTAEIIAQLPDWSGTPVSSGELFAGHFTDEAPYLTLVTPSVRVIALLGSGVSPDDAADTLARLSADWAT